MTHSVSVLPAEAEGEDDVGMGRDTPTSAGFHKPDSAAGLWGGAPLSGPGGQTAARMRSASRFRGALLGLACGDALGASVVGLEPGKFEPITDMIGGGPFGLMPGQWTDDTSMALCLAESLVECGRFDPVDQLERYIRWWREGHLSSTGRCFDMGNTTHEALTVFERTRDPRAGPTHERSAGNGSIMRLAPVPMAFFRQPREAIRLCAESSLTTHGVRVAVDACRYFGGLLVGALSGVRKDELLSPLYSPVAGLWDEQPLAPEIEEVAQGTFVTRDPPDIRGSGYVVRSLEAALWAFHRSEDFRDGCLLAANLGDDADTTGAVYGQLAGAYYGEDSIPGEWREKLHMRAYIEELADELLALAQHDAGRGENVGR